MKKAISLFVFILLVFGFAGIGAISGDVALASSPSPPEMIPLDCQGCCSYHGGVACIGGVTKCRDGSPLSEKCLNKGCNKCN